MKTQEQLEFDIFIKASQALAEIKKLQAGTEKYSSSMQKLIALTEKYAAVSGTSFQTASKRLGNPQFARFPGQYSQFDTGAGVRGLKEVGVELEQIPPKQAKVAQGFSIIRSAMGFMMAYFMSNVVSMIAQGIQKIIDSTSQLEQSFIKLSVAEKSISAAGVDITPQELLDIADKVAKTYVTVSKIDASKMVSSLAVLTKDLKLSAKEYEKLALAIPLVAQQAGVSIDSATEQVITGLTKSGRGWADLGITVDAAIIRQQAIKSGLVASATAYNNLTAEQKQQIEVLALLDILEKNVAVNLEEQNQYNNTLAGSQTALSAAWEDFASSLGKIASPTIVQFLQSLTKSLEAMNGWIEKNADSLDKMATAFKVLTGGVAPFLSGESISGGFFGGLSMAIPWVDDSAFGGLLRLLKGNKQELKDTPTAIIDPIDEEGTIAKADEDINKAFEELAKDIEKEMRDFENKKLEAKIDLDLKIEDINIKYAQNVEDIIRKHGQKIADIITNYNQKVADIQADYAMDEAQAQEEFNQQEIQAEKDKEEALLRLKEDYLMNLEDALHERDARQVLKLMKQYEIDKDRINRDAAAEAEERKQKFEAEKKQRLLEMQWRLQQAAIERDRAIADANLARQRELEEAALARKRDLEEAKRNYQRKLQELQREHKRELQELGNALKAQFNLTAAQAKALAQMLAGNVNAYSNYLKTIVGMTNSALNSMSASAGGGGQVVTNPTLTSSSGVFAGATLSASLNPTKSSLGSIASTRRGFTPVLGGETSGGGRLAIELFLSPDLEARVVDNAMNQTADVMLRTMRGK